MSSVNSQRVLEKLFRDLEMESLSPSRGNDYIDCQSIRIDYVDAAGDAPMIGIQSSSSPFLGIGVARPGSLRLSVADGGTASNVDTLAEFFSYSGVSAANQVLRMKVLKSCIDKGNDVILAAAATNLAGAKTELARLRGHIDHIGAGQ